MTYKIIFSQAADKSFAKLDKSVKRRIFTFLEERVKPNPDLLKQALQGSKRGLWKYRVGDYRIICDIKKHQLIVLVIDIGHRSEVYK
jgi:mRNA interferase RelE/StbE